MDRWCKLEHGQSKTRKTKTDQKSNIIVTRYIIKVSAKNAPSAVLQSCPILVALKTEVRPCSAKISVICAAIMGPLAPADSPNEMINIVRSPQLG